MKGGKEGEREEMWRIWEKGMEVKGKERRCEEGRWREGERRDVDDG